jgi:uroporphyrinogen decarboxylase
VPLLTLLEIVQVFDSSAGELSPRAFKDFALPYLDYISRHLPWKLAELGLEKVPMVVFAKGSWYALDDLCNTDYDIISLDWTHDPAEAYAIAQKKGKVLQGNMDPGVLYGSKASITAAVQIMVDGFGGGKRGGWISNLGHGTSSSKSCPRPMLTNSGVTPFIDKEKLRFYFQEIHRLTSS